MTRRRMKNKRDVCPTCGRPWGTNRGGWNRLETWTAAVGQVIQSGATYERREPSRMGNVQSDLVLPVGQSGVTAVVGLLAGAVGAYLLNTSLVGGVALALLGAAAAFSLTWLVLLSDHRRLLWIVETITGEDVDHDGIVGEPPVVKVELRERHAGGDRWAFLELPISEEKLADVARAVLVARQNFSRPELCSRNRILSQTEYHELALAMEDAGLIVKLPNNRRELSGAGRAMFRGLLPDGR